MLLTSIVNPFPPLDQTLAQAQIDGTLLQNIIQQRYLQVRTPVLQVRNLHLAWEYAQSPETHHRFQQMLRVEPETFQVLLELIQDHSVFSQQSNNTQAPVETQLAVTLFCMGRFGNGASIKDIACQAGCSEGSVINYTLQCFTAIADLHDLFIRKLTPEEKEKEKEWVDEQVGFHGSWRDG